MVTSRPYAHVKVGIETYPKGTIRPRHGHWEGHAAVILAGSYHPQADLPGSDVHRRVAPALAREDRPDGCKQKIDLGMIMKLLPVFTATVGEGI